MENTSYIAQISYKIEIMLNDGVTFKEIKSEIESRQGRGTFPKNLELVDAYFDKAYGSSACAFLDTTTGETIVGFAGTNLKNGAIDAVNDVGTDLFGLGVTGIGGQAPYFDEANKFMKNLEENGYNITQATGHSLGGALCVYMGINYDIPQIVSYNGAPLYVAPTAYLTGNAQSIKDKLKDYDGEIIRFVSDEDWLNPLADTLNGFYVGDEYLISNGRPHDIEFFVNEEEQKYITDIVSSNKFGEISVGSIDFDKDGNIDLSLTTEDLIVKNLFGINGSYSGNGTTIKIDPYAFTILNKNLNTSMADGDINWINNAVKLCNDKNDTIKND